MSYNIVLTTAEDIVAVVDAVIAKGSEAAKDFIAEFTGIATDDQVLKALQMACELQLIVFDSSRGCYGSPSFLARKLVSASSDEQKAVFMRLILEQYAPYNTFKTRYGFTKSIELACRQTKTLHMMTSNERDVKNTLEFVGQVRNAADHGADPDENNQVWTISNETARIYPCIIAALIKAIFSRDATGSIEV